MTTLLVLCFFALGAILASFAGVIAVRMHTGESFLVARSRCDACNTSLGASSLVPIFSYAVSGGRAQCCGARVSFWAPLSEAALGAAFVLAYGTLGISLSLPFMFAALVLLLTLVMYDAAHQILPPGPLTAFVILSAITGFLSAASVGDFLQTVVIASLIGLSLLAIHLLSKGRAMGFSDAPLAFGLALLTGHAALPGFLFSFWIGAAIGIVLLLKRPGGSRMDSEVPFAPYLAAGFLLAYFTQWNPLILATALLPNK